MAYASHKLLASYLLLALIALCSLRVAHTLSLFGGGSAGAGVGANQASAFGMGDSMKNDVNIRNEEQAAASLQLQSGSNLPTSMGQAMSMGQEAAGSLQSGQKQLTNAVGQQLGSSTVNKLLELGINPVNYFPETYASLTKELGSGLSMVSNDAQKGYSTFNMMLPSFGGSYGSSGPLYNNRFTETLLRRLAESELMVRRLYELTQDPEQMCRQAMQQGQMGLQSANQALANQQNSLSSSASSMMNKLAGSAGGSVWLG